MSMDIARRAADVWRGLAEVFGPNFHAVYGTDPAPLWIQELALFTDEQCRGAVEAMRARKGGFPCNLTEFCAAARACSTTTRRQPEPRTDGQRALARPEVRDTYLSRMKARLAEANGRVREPGEDG